VIVALLAQGLHLGQLSNRTTCMHYIKAKARISARKHSKHYMGLVFRNKEDCHTCQAKSKNDVPNSSANDNNSDQGLSD
jgi:hypothetical protein